MQNALLTVGLIALVGAIVGGGIKLLGGELPLIQSKRRQFILGGFGIVLIIWSAAIGDSGSGGGAAKPISVEPDAGGGATNPAPVETLSPPAKEPPRIDKAALSAELAANQAEIEKREDEIELGVRAVQRCFGVVF